MIVEEDLRGKNNAHMMVLVESCQHVVTFRLGRLGLYDWTASVAITGIFSKRSTSGNSWRSNKPWTQRRMIGHNAA